MIFNPKPNYPTYPPYHIGLYLEDYFINFLEKQQIKTNKTFIKVGWTSYYNNGFDRIKLQNFLNTLPTNENYFVVCQHDDAPQEKLPKNTIIFSAGGNIRGQNVIPIPLICSSIIDPPKIKIENKDIFCSFVGSTTHSIRKILQEKYQSKYKFYQTKWSSSVSKDQLNNFIDITSRSKFALCPRGYGPSSFRLYESMQLGTVPVYVSDYHHLPWSDKINWNDICVIIKEQEINDIDNILSKIDDNVYKKMLNKIEELYDTFFTLEGVCQNILEKIQ